eukprot:UN07118
MGLTPSSAPLPSPSLTSSPLPPINPASRSNSSLSLSQTITCDSLSNSAQSKTSRSRSIARQFVSYPNENATLYIQANNNKNKNQSWTIKLARPNKCKTQTQTQDAHVLFGICDSSVAHLSHKHKFYGYGTSITYCHGFKFYSYCASFKISSPIIIKYNKHNRQISFWQNGINKKQIIVQHHPLNEYAITIKSYKNEYTIQILE